MLILDIVILICLQWSLSDGVLRINLLKVSHTFFRLTLLPTSNVAPMIFFIHFLQKGLVLVKLFDQGKLLTLGQKIVRIDIQMQEYVDDCKLFLNYIRIVINVILRGIRFSSSIAA